ncbi:MAG: UDP-N-acetylglucosamine 1-carboxyvinyltransferase [Pseudobdellovibrionaceae bacterium]
MDKIIVKGGLQLNGRVRTSGAKNSALPILFSTLLAEGEHVFRNVPRLKDIESTCQLLEMLGCQTNWNKDVLRIKVNKPASLEAHYDVVRKMRASILCLGPLLSHYGEAVVSLPGGCAIGTRPIDLHLEGMKSLGAEIILESGYVRAKAKRLRGGTILFEMCTVGGTENVMMAACLAEGTTVLENAAKEPEIVDLAEYLNKMGARISGHGTSIIKIEGVEKLRPSEHSIMSDRIEAGTLLIAGAITGGEVTVENCKPEFIDSLIIKMREAGFTIDTGKDTTTVRRCHKWTGVDITTNPYPLFPTDLQAQFMALATVADGTSVITETVFENRFMHVQELVRLGADIVPKTRVAVIHGVKSLAAAPVMATDLRASASLVLAGLAAKGETMIGRIYHLDRGYEDLEGKLRSLGADIKRVN